MDDKKYPSNSHKDRSEAEEERIKQRSVIRGPVATRKKGVLSRIKDTFFGGDIDDVSSYVIRDVLIPAAKNTAFDMVKEGFEMLLFPGDPRGSRSRRDRGGSRVNYSSISYDRDRRDRREPVRSRSRHHTDDVIFSSRGDAEDVKNHLIDLVEEYGFASLGDFYDLAGITGSFTDNKYGWDNLSGTRINRVRDGYVINLPRPILID